MTYPIKKIAVIGATGMLGLPVTRALTNAGFDVTALARKPEDARAKLPTGVQVLTADVKDEKSLTKAFSEMDAVYVSLSITNDQTSKDFWVESEGMKAIVSACRSAGVQRVAYLSSAMQKHLGLFSPNMDYVRHISEALNTTPEPFTADKTWADLGKPPTTLAQFARTLKP